MTTNAGNYREGYTVQDSAGSFVVVRWGMADYATCRITEHGLEEEHTHATLRAATDDMLSRFLAEADDDLRLKQANAPTTLAPLPRL